MSKPLHRYLGYDRSLTIPNIVVDGSPNDATVLTLSHWPGIAQPPGTDVDTSAEMAFDYLDGPTEHEPAKAVTNNHFDQDGAVGILALIDPDEALAHREVLVDLARAGDFGTYRYRNAARASMILNAFADPERSPVSDHLSGDVGTDTEVIYTAVLPALLGMIADPAPYRELWVAEDDALSASEEALADGQVGITEYPELDLAVVEIEGDQPERFGHRFGHMQVGPIHQMAVHNATASSRILMMHGRRYRYIDRYETWVQVHTSTPPQRVDLRPLARALTATESGPIIWTAGAPSSLTPTLDHDADSTLDAGTILMTVRRHLEESPPAWNPYRLV